MTEFQYGDYLEALDFCYSHHGIYIDHSVIHLNKKDGITISSVEGFASNRKIRVIPHPDVNPDETVNRAFDLMLNHELKYNLIFWNCETFVLATLGKIPVSKQVTDKIKMLLHLLYKVPF